MVKTLFSSSLWIAVLLTGALVTVSLTATAQLKPAGDASPHFTIARLKYGGGGDWYGNKTALNNLLKFIKQNRILTVQTEEVYVDPEDVRMFDYPILYMAGHGNVRFSDKAMKQLRAHLTNGGFLWCDDDYGIDPAFRREMKRIFPELDFVEVPFSHPIFSVVYSFPNGLPKIHEHDGGPPQAYALFWNGRMICFYSKNTDISDGLEGPTVFPEDPVEKHHEALKMATNIIVYALSQ